MRKSDVVFFLTGAAALGYETAWARLLARVLGSDAPAAAVVLAVFMGGMGLGAWAFAGLARTTKSPVKLFALFEIVIAAWAAITPFVLTHLHPVESFALRALVASGILLVPTVLLGATFPLMARLTIRTSAETGSETSAFYGANTLGAAFGALLGPFLLMPRLGLSGAVYAAAVLDVIAAVLALKLLRDATVSEEAVDARASAPATVSAAAAAIEAKSRSTRLDPLLLAAFLFGASSLALEVLLLRLLVTVTGASVYAFALITFTFLLGIGLGARQLSERRTRTGVPESALEQRAKKSRDAVVWCGLLIPLLALAGLLALRFQLGETDLFGGLENRTAHGASVVRVWLGHLLFAALALLPPAIAFGIALPSAASALVARRPNEPRERTLGTIYAWNTAGALIGSLVAAFVLLPTVGPRVAVAIAIALPFVAALLIDRSRVQLAAMVAIAGGAVGWIVLAPKDGGRAVLAIAHDAHTTALVQDSRTTAGAAVRSLRVNGKAEASTVLVDLRLQYLLGHIPGLLHGNVKHALVIGLGTGMTAGSLLDFPTLERLRIFEISPAVAKCAREFAQWNGRVLDDPRTQMVFRDGRNALATTEERFDLITSDPVHPWTRGSSDLYTLEHFTTMREHLSEGGVASQWLPLYELSTDDVKTIVATWCAAFPRTSAWLTAYDLVLIGSSAPLTHEPDLVSLPLPPGVRERDKTVGVDSGVDVAALQVAGDAELRALVSGVSPMRDDRPVIEFRAPLASLSGYSTDILRWAIRPEYVAVLPPSARAAATKFRAKVDSFLDALPNGFTHAADQLGAELRTSAATVPRGPRDELAVATSAEEALERQLDQAVRDGKAQALIETMAGEYKAAVANTDRLVSQVSTTDVIATVPSVDLLANESAWKRSGFDSWRIQDGVLTAVGPAADSDRVAIMTIGDPAAWHDVVLDSELTLVRGHATLYFRLQDRAVEYLSRVGATPPEMLEDYGPTPLSFRLAPREEDNGNDFNRPMYLETGRGHPLFGSFIGSAGLFRLPENVVWEDPEIRWTRSRRGRFAISLSPGSEIRITRMRIKVLR